jgi:hypothetical protein
VLQLAILLKNVHWFSEEISTPGEVGRWFDHFGVHSNFKGQRHSLGHMFRNMAVEQPVALKLTKVVKKFEE